MTGTNTEYKGPGRRRRKNKMREQKRRQTIKEWELETGIKVKDPKGFTNWSGRSKTRTNKYTKEQFRRCLRTSIITVKYNKGIEFIAGEETESEQWRSFIRTKGQRKEK